MTLFAHLAFKFGSHPENLATEALAYVLGRSPNARRSFLQAIGTPGAESADLRFNTQVSSEEHGRPDLEGVDGTGTVRLLVEAKFWAGFTEHQPAGYLKLLPVDGVLLVIGPHIRLEYLWREIVRRLDGQSVVVDSPPNASDMMGLTIDGRHLVLTSWRYVLGAIEVALSGEPAVREDVTQLAALCARMDSEAFLPMTSAEVTSQVFRRVHEFGQMVDTLVAKLAAEPVPGSNGHVMNVKGLRNRGGNGWYGRYARLRGVPVMLQVSTWKWTKLAASPLWLTVYGMNWARSNAPSTRAQLSEFDRANPGRVFADKDGNPTVMVSVPTGAEWDEVIAHVAEQLRRIGDVIAPLATGAAVDVPPPDADIPAG
jgi:hypothetical protein